MAMLQGKVALVTGGGKGIGAAIARGFALEGAAVAVVSRTRDQLDATVASIEQAGGVGLAIPADLSAPDAPRAIVAEVLDRLGRLDILVCNAAGASVVAPVVEMPIEKFRALHAINLESTILLLQAAGPHMIERGSGKVIIVSSTLGLNGNPGSSAYGSSKAALNHLARTVAWEWGAYGINVNALVPGPVATERVQHVLDQPGIRDHILDLMAIREYPAADDMIGPALFLASDMSRSITGHLLVADNGISAVAREAGNQPRNN